MVLYSFGALANLNEAAVHAGASSVAPVSQHVSVVNSELVVNPTTPQFARLCSSSDSTSTSPSPETAVAVALCEVLDAGCPHPVAVSHAAAVTPSHAASVALPSTTTVAAASVALPPTSAAASVAPAPNTTTVAAASPVAPPPTSAAASVAPPNTTTVAAASPVAPPSTSAAITVAPPSTTTAVAAASVAPPPTFGVAAASLDDVISELREAPLTVGALMAENKSLCSRSYTAKKKKVLSEFIFALRAKSPKYDTLLLPAKKKPSEFPSGDVPEVFVLLSGPGEKRKKVHILNQMLIDWIAEKEYGKGTKKQNEEQQETLPSGAGIKYPTPSTLNNIVRTFFAAAKSHYGWEFTQNDFDFEGGYNAFFKHLCEKRQRADVSYL